MKKGLIAQYMERCQRNPEEAVRFKDLVTMEEEEAINGATKKPAAEKPAARGGKKR